MKIVPANEIPREVADVDVGNLMPIYDACMQMETICSKMHGIGLAAPQVGIAKRFFIMKNETGQYEHYVNCDYIPAGDEKAVSVESCLTLGKMQYRLLRYVSVRLVGYRLLAEEKPVLQPVDKELTGFSAVVVQHEIDHQRGLLLSDVGKPFFLW